MDNWVPVTLPSGCKVYAGVEPGSVEIRPLVGRDEEILVQLGGDNSSKKILLLFKSVLKGIDPVTLTTGDAQHVLLWEAINSYSDTYPVGFVCMECLHRQEGVATLKDIESVELPEEFKQPYPVSLSGGVVIKLRLRTLQDDVNLIEYVNAGNTGYLFNFAQCIVDSDLDILQRVEMLNNLNVKDLAKIRGFFEKFKHGPDMIAPVVCNKCNHEEKIEIPFRFSTIIEHVAIFRVSV